MPADATNEGIRPMSGPDGFRPVTRAEPCEICGKPDWCRRTTDGAHECHRVNDVSVNGYVRIAQTPAGFAVYRRPEDRPSPKCRVSATTPKRRRIYDCPEAAAESLARWKGGSVERVYRWSDDWCRGRIRQPNGKTFCEITRDGAGWVLRGPPKPRLLYRIGELPSVGIIVVCEGEKPCDAGWSIGLPCVTSGASDSARSADWTKLDGREVAILPDHDEPGARYADDVARQLKALDPAAIVRIVELPGLDAAEDLHDFINEHRDSRTADEIKAEIMALIASTPQYQIPDEPRASAGEWPDPQPLPDELPPVMPFDFDLLPSSLRPWIRDIAERVQCPPDFPAIAAMIAIATVVGRKVGIRPKRHDDWLVVPNLWGAAIGPPSVMKTPAIQEPLKPLRRLEIEAKEKFDAEMKEHEVRQLVADQRKQLAKTAIKKALTSEDGDPLATAREALQDDTPPPVRRRYLVNDSTVEKLGEILNQNSNGVLSFRDELIGLLKSLDKEGQEGARSFYLEAWNGNGRYTYDRIGRGTIDIEATIVSLIGSIQPGPLRSYVRGAVAGNESADGLMQRFQLSVYPDISKSWRNVDRWPDTEAKSRAFEVVRALDRLNPLEVGAQTDNEGGDEIPFLRFAPEAQDRFDGWRAELEHRLRAGTEHPVMVAHLAKYRSLIPSLALLCHLAGGRSGPVGIDSLGRGIAWGFYLESHARRILSVAVAPDAAEAIELAKKIVARELPDEFALRDIYRNHWVGLSTHDEALRAVEVLVDMDWLVRVDELTTGRPRTRYVVNPRVERRIPK
jgi:putative DNA primase/helicase